MEATSVVLDERYKQKCLNYVQKIILRTEDVKKLKNACVAVCVVLRPHCIFEGSGMLQYSKILVENRVTYGSVDTEKLLPARTIVSKHVKETCDPLLNDVTSEIKIHLKQPMHVACTTDLWTDNNRRKSYFISVCELYFSLTCHYISEDWKLVHCALGCQEFKSDKK